MPHGSTFANLRDLIDVFGEDLASGATITYTDEHGSWTLRDVAVSETGFGGFVEG